MSGLVVWLALCLWAALLAPVPELPRSNASWDVVHSGRLFAEQGFVASKLQPVWAPPNHRSQYLTYTHYPPLPHWIAGLVFSVVRDPLVRIGAIQRLALVVGISTVLCGYAFLRRLGIGVPGAALACGALVMSGEWWWLVSSDLTWVGWLDLFLFGGAAAACNAFGGDGRRSRADLALTVGCAAAAAASAFDAWLWFPALLGGLALYAARSDPRRLQTLVLATAVVSAASVGAAATRVALNIWHFGSPASALRDFREAYGARSTYASASLTIAENRANYAELPTRAAASHAKWIAELLRTLPERLVAMYLPASRGARWACVAVAALGLAGALTQRARSPDRWPGRWIWLALLAGAALPFALICTAIAVQQDGALLAFAPAVLLAGAWLFDAADRLWGRVAPRRLLTAVIVCAAVLSPVLRGPAPGGAWPAPPARLSEAVTGLANLEGVVFVDLDDVSPLVFLTPLDARVAFKPVWAQARYLADVRPIRILRIPGAGKLSERELAKLEPIEEIPVPEGFAMLGPRGRP